MTDHSDLLSKISALCIANKEIIELIEVRRTEKVIQKREYFVQINDLETGFVLLEKEILKIDGNLEIPRILPQSGDKFGKNGGSINFGIQRRNNTTEIYLANDVIVKSWKCKTEFISISDLFNDKINYDCSNFEDLKK